VTVEGAAAPVVKVPDTPVRVPTVAVMLVKSPALLLGVNAVVAVPVEPVVAVVGDTPAVNPLVGYVPLVMLKVTGTPGCPVESVAVMVIGLEPAVKLVEVVGLTVMDVPAARAYTVHVGPGYDPGLEPPSISVVVKEAVGGAAVAGEAVLAVIVPSPTVSVKPGARLPVKTTAPAVRVGAPLR
jgi:hypothetical protein